jgi:putative membrane protein
LLRPIDAAMTGDIVEGDLKTANAGARMSKNVTARAARDVAIAKKNAQEEASGAGLVDFTVLVTATVTGDDLDDTAAAVASLASASKLRMRPAFGAQDSAFALALPLGVVPSWQKVWSI